MHVKANYCIKCEKDVILVSISLILIKCQIIIRVYQRKMHRAMHVQYTCNTRTPYPAKTAKSMPSSFNLHSSIGIELLNWLPLKIRALKLVKFPMKAGISPLKLL